MSEKKNNFLPLLLVGGGVGAAALLIAKNSAKSKEDTSILGGGGFGGSGDFFGNSESYNPAVTPSGGVVTPSGGVPMSSTPVILPILYPDSMDAGIEDIARDDVNLGLTDPSDGGVNPNNYSPTAPNNGGSGPSGVDIAQELALYAGATAAVSAAGYGAKKAGSAIKKAGTKAAGKVATSGAGQVANTATEKAATKAGQNAATKAGGKAAGVTAGKVASTIGKGAGVLGLLGAVDMVFDITGVKDAHFSQGGLTGNLQGVNTSFSVNTGGITTDKQTTNEVGNMGLTDRQQKYLSNMKTFGGTTREATAEEAAEINKRYGSSGSVGVYEYSGKTGKQTTYVTSTGKTVTNPSGVSKPSQSATKSNAPSASSLGSAISSAASAVSSFFSGLFGGK